jgi:hypothetical protein
LVIGSAVSSVNLEIGFEAFVVDQASINSENHASNYRLASHKIFECTSMANREHSLATRNGPRETHLGLLWYVRDKFLHSSHESVRWAERRLITTWNTDK